MEVGMNRNVLLRIQYKYYKSFKVHTLGLGASWFMTASGFISYDFQTVWKPKIVEIWSSLYKCSSFGMHGSILPKLSEISQISSLELIKKLGGENSITMTTLIVHILVCLFGHHPPEELISPRSGVQVFFLRHNLCEEAVISE